MPPHSEVVEPAEPAGAAAGDGRTVQRTLTVLDFVSARAGSTAPGVVEIARGVGLEKSVVSRLLRVLVDTGLLVRDPGLGYRIGPRLFTVAAGAQDARLVELGTRAVAALVDRFGERAELYTRAGNVAMTLATASPDSPLQVTGWLGRTYPLVSTAAGRALLLAAQDADVVRLVETVGITAAGPNAPRSAEDVLTRLAADRDRGVCVAVDEVDRGLLALAAPVRDSSGHVVASIVVSGPSDRVRDRFDDVSEDLPLRAAEVSAGLGHVDADSTRRVPLSVGSGAFAPSLEVTP